jgi:menaquinone-dependent protoporphyrinogen oxidase
MSTATTHRPVTKPSTGAGNLRVLVAYASKYGSTKGVAERIAANLQVCGDRVELLPVDEVADAGVYDAVIFGSAVFNQRWLPEAEQFVQRNREALASRPVWLFSVGTFGDCKRIIGPLMKREPKGIHTLDQAIHPREYRVFAGVIDRHRWPSLSRLFYHSLGGHLGDNRDWPAIEAWADRIRQALRSTNAEEAPHPATGL